MAIRNQHVDGATLVDSQTRGMNNGFATKRVNRMGAPSFLGFSDASPAAEPAAAKRQPELARRKAAIVALLQVKPMTLVEMVAAGAGTMDQVNGAIYRMKKDGVVVTASQRDRVGGKRWGRTTEDVYGLAAIV